MDKDGKKDISLQELYDLITSVQTALLLKIEDTKIELQGEIKEFKNETQAVREDFETLRQENAELRAKLDIAEKQFKRKNLIFQGIAENSTSTEKTILDLAKNKLQISLSLSDISNCYRLGRDSGKTRPILVEFLSQFKKREVLSARTKLKGTHIYINEDLTKEELYERKILLDVKKDQRLTNCKTRLKGNKLEVEGILYTYEDISEKKRLPPQFLSTTLPSPSPEKLSSSAPHTPLPENKNSQHQKGSIEEAQARKVTEKTQNADNPEHKRAQSSVKDTSSVSEAPVKNVDLAKAKAQRDKKNQETTKEKAKVLQLNKKNTSATSSPATPKSVSEKNKRFIYPTRYASASQSEN